MQSENMPKKIAWIHTDYSVVAVDRESELKMWAAYDKIVSISDQVTDAFVQTFPELKEKVIMLPHFIPVEYIKRLSEAGNAPEMEKRGDEIRLLSIGRFCVQKNFDNVPDICRRLRERGLHVKWYLIGYGAEEIIRQKIKEAADRFGTPLYLFDLDTIRDRVQRFREAFRDEIELTYSMKTNPFLTLEMARQVERIEVCSMGEFRICRDLAIPAEKLYISGVLKIREDLMEILAYGQDAARYTAESPLQLQMLSDWADAHGKTLRVYPRLTNKSQFGMDEDTICDLIANREKYPHIEFAGIHFFSGTQKKLRSSSRMRARTGETKRSSASRLRP